MKKIMLLAFSVLIVVCILPAHAGKPMPETQCVNTPVSKFFDLPSATSDLVIMSVDADMMLVLTDIGFSRVANSNLGFVNLFEDETEKCYFMFEHPASGNAISPTLHFNTGVSFAPGSNVILKTGGTWGRFFFAGYLTNCF